MNKYTKYITLMVIGLVVVAQAQAACNGGTWVTSRKATDSGCTASTCNEKTFCVSDSGMNWWSAMAWCKANGMQLASFDSVCPETVRSGTCQNWNGKGQVWLRTFSSGDTAWLLRPLLSYKVYEWLRANRHMDSTDVYAICEEITTSSTP